ncbi:hypothetical protein NA56DRAFT_741653 [Hyaloscypha hepaticicola]|uniref:Uncharacterized protein n=1 Tax=Hyaloscypha hepaticicola TaxID=2082293 RepID=A0A2J6PDW4_9HELO|nr:hypothetical protein NA56DRAFT_741653 [Hyaloscypha hepaticicola]
MAGTVYEQINQSINQSEFSHYSLTSRPEFVRERTGGISCRVRNLRPASGVFLPFEGAEGRNCINIEHKENSLNKRPPDARLMHMLRSSPGCTAYQERVPLPTPRLRIQTFLRCSMSLVRRLYLATNARKGRPSWWRTQRS